MKTRKEIVDYLISVFEENNNPAMLIDTLGETFSTIADKYYTNNPALEDQYNAIVGQLINILIYIKDNKL